MSKKRQRRLPDDRGPEDGIQVRTLAARYADGYALPAHAHDWHQLIYATEGVMSVHTAHGSWVIPSHRAVWVPAGVEHAMEMSGPVLLQSLYVAKDLSDALPHNCCAVNVSPLLRELILEAVRTGYLDRAVPAQARLTGVLLDQLKVLPTIPLQLPLPRDPRASQVAAWLRQRPGDPGLLKQAARRTGASVRTLERLFVAETGLTFGRWRQQLRLLHALRLLAGGQSVSAVALAVGYETPSAFIAMFRRALGTTPSRYFTAEVRTADFHR